MSGNRDEENEIEIERAIDEILKYDFSGIYRKVVNNESKTHPEMDKVS